MSNKPTEEEIQKEVKEQEQLVYKCLDSFDYLSDEALRVLAEKFKADMASDDPIDAATIKVYKALSELCLATINNE